LNTARRVDRASGFDADHTAILVMPQTHAGGQDFQFCLVAGGGDSLFQVFIM